MRRPALFALVLIVLLPVALLGGLGWRWLDDEQQAIAHRLQSLVDAQLSDVDAQLSAYFREQQARLRAVAGKLPLDAGALRAYARADPRVRQAFVMDAEGERLHPPTDARLSEAEQRFLERTAELWADKAILYQSAPADLPEQAGGDDGWYVWHWGAATHWIYWRRESDGSDGHLLGFELEPVRVLADLINRLPATDTNATQTTQSHVRLIDSGATVIYQWGDYQPDERQAPLSLRPLSHPLGSWKLAYFAPALHAAGSPLWLLGGVLSIAAAALVGLAVYLYREQTRERRLAQQRVNFVNQVSHELKTPLTNIRLYAELLDEQWLDDAEDSKARRYLSVIVDESQRLTRLITNVLSFAGWQRGRLRLHKRPGCVDEVVAAALAAFRPALQAKNFAIDWDADAAAAVQLDPDALEQILNNLLGNIEKYAAGGERVAIVTRQRDGMSIIEVRDYGPGIPERERERIFRPFYRLSDKLSDGVTGAGIGLAIARELARLHGGELRLLASESGCRFQVSLRTEHL